LLTSALRATVKDSKEEIMYEFHVKNVSFLIFNVVKTQVPIKSFFFGLLNKCQQVPQGHLLAFSFNKTTLY